MQGQAPPTGQRSLNSKRVPQSSRAFSPQGSQANQPAKEEGTLRTPQSRPLARRPERQERGRAQRPALLRAPLRAAVLGLAVLGVGARESLDARGTEAVCVPRHGPACAVCVPTPGPTRTPDVAKHEAAERPGPGACTVTTVQEDLRARSGPRRDLRLDRRMVRIQRRWARRRAAALGLPCNAAPACGPTSGAAPPAG